MSVCSSVGWLVCKKVSQKATPYLQKNIVLDSLHPVPGDGVGVHQLQHGQPVSPGHVQSAHRGKIAKASSLNWTYEFFFFKIYFGSKEQKKLHFSPKSIPQGIPKLWLLSNGELD